MTIAKYEHKFNLTLPSKAQIQRKLKPPELVGVGGRHEIQYLNVKIMDLDFPRNSNKLNICLVVFLGYFLTQWILI